MLENLRNIGIIAHIDAGKTTTTERILFYSGKEHAIGAVDEGTATMDSYGMEAERGITIFSATTQIQWGDHRINIIDTPGHVDFTAEVERSLRVLDGAVVIFDGVAGVQAQSETVWRQADKYNVPRLAFINKLDRTGADYERAVGTIEARLGAITIPLQIPLGVEAEMAGVVDLIEMESVTFSEEDQGATVTRGPIPEGLADEAAMARERMLERIYDHDEMLMGAALEGEVDAAQIRDALRRVTITGAAVPVLCGTSLKNKGVQPLLDAICAYLPSPHDRPPVIARDPRTEAEREYPPDPKGDVLLLAFKTMSDQHGELTYLRVYSGTIKKGEQLYNPRSGKTERMHGLCYMHSSKPEKLEEAGAGQIVAVRGLRFTVTGDSLCRKNAEAVLERLTFPETVVSMSIEPETTGERAKLDQVLEKLARDDPTFRTHTDPETGQLIVSGMGELHLDVIKNRMITDFNVACVVGKPRVSYKETLVGRGAGHGRFERKVGEKLVFAAVDVAVAPLEGTLVRFVDALPEGHLLPTELRQAVREAAVGAAESGALAGFPMIGLELTLTDAEYRPEEGTPAAFSAATSQAASAAIEQAGAKLLEPIMTLQVEVPEESLGDVLGDLQARRADIRDMASLGDLRTIEARVAISAMFGYASQLRGLSQGRGSYSMEPSGYAEVPAEVARKYTF